MSIGVGKLAFSLVTLLVAPSVLVFGQSATVSSLPVATRQSVAQTATAALPNAPRIPAHADLSPRLRLPGHLPAWVATASDTGPVPAETILHLDFVLTRTEDAQTAFNQFLHDQQTPGSPLYHAWLKPQQIGDLYGPAQADLDLLTGWLIQQGFHIDEIAPSRLFLRVSAPAPVAATALGTSFRMLALAGAPSKPRLSATSEPAIPAALSVLVSSIAGLTEVPEEPQHRMEIVPAATPAAALQPNFTSSSSGNHYIAPGDFSVLYDVPSTYNGTGQKIAIIGRSQVNPADITNFQASVGLPSKLPNVVIPPTGADPGLSPGDQGEATLDVQRVAGTAPGAQADLVIASNASGGLRTAIQYNVQTLLDPIMTISFGACEANAGLANVNLYTQLFSQAAAEGISVFVSSGDSGAAGCDTHGAAPPTTTQIASINYICSSGFATCVGGTEFAADLTSPAAYWSTTNSDTRESAIAFIPEGAWNQPSSTDATTGATAYTIASTGGGVSIYTAKPAFQTGSGVPNDSFRDTPDISFSSAGHDPYFGCYAQTGGGNCVRDPITGLFSYVGFYGTSAAAPGMAGVAALLNQKLGSAQGNLNPLIYRLANGTAANVFHDTTVASSGVSNCTVAVPSLCNNSTPSATALTGGLAGYLLTPGYDLATGWGSFDVANLLTAAAGTGLSSTTTLTGTSGNIQLTTPTVSFHAAVAAGSGSGLPTGTVQFFSNGKSLGSPVTLVSGVASLSLSNTFTFGTYLVTASYSGDATYDPSNSAAVTFTVVPGTTPDILSLATSPTPVSTTQISTLLSTIRVAAGGPAPNGTITFSQVSGGLLFTIISTPVDILGNATVRITFGGGTYVVVASYSGDATYAASTSPSVTITPTLAPSVTTLTGTQALASKGTDTLGATVTGLTLFTTPTDTVTFSDGTTSLGSAALVRTTAGTGVAVFTTAALTSGTHSLTATFSGDTSTLPSTSAPFVVTVAPPPGITEASAASSLTLAAGATQGNTDILTFTSVGGFTGTLALSCAVTYNGTGTATLPPTCALNGSSVTLTAAGTATSTLAITTTLPQANGGTPQARNHPPSLYRVSTVSAAFALLLACVPIAARRRFPRNGWTLFLLLIGFTGLLTLAGCSKTTPIPAPAPVKIGTSTGSYTVTVTASSTSGGFTVTTTSPIALTVQ